MSSPCARTSTETKGARSVPRPERVPGAFGLGGVVSNFGLALDLVGFLLVLVFVAATSVLGLMRRSTVPSM